MPKSIEVIRARTRTRSFLKQIGTHGVQSRGGNRSGRVSPINIKHRIAFSCTTRSNSFLRASCLLAHQQRTIPLHLRFNSFGSLRIISPLLSRRHHGVAGDLTSHFGVPSPIGRFLPCNINIVNIVGQPRHNAFLVADPEGAVVSNPPRSTNSALTRDGYKLFAPRQHSNLLGEVVEFGQFRLG